jgi:hypothetical protein
MEYGAPCNTASQSKMQQLKHNNKPKYWIAKVPDYLLSAWENTEPGVQVATLFVPERKQNDPPLKKCKLTLLNSSDDIKIPKEYEFVIRKEYIEQSAREPDQIAVFSESDGMNVSSDLFI